MPTHPQSSLILVFVHVFLPLKHAFPLMHAYSQRQERQLGMSHDQWEQISFRRSPPPPTPSQTTPSLYYTVKEQVEYLAHLPFLH